MQVSINSKNIVTLTDNNGFSQTAEVDNFKSIIAKAVNGDQYSCTIIKALLDAKNTYYFERSFIKSRG